MSKFFRKIGFYYTFDILSLENPMKLRIFFERLHKFGSYYNAFYRIKGDLLKNGLIEIYDTPHKSRMIKLTPKGLDFKKNLDSLMAYL